MVKPQVVVQQFYASGASVKDQENRSVRLPFCVTLMTDS
jgi:hypothetical protein